MKIYLFLLLSISSFRNQKVSGNELHNNTCADARVVYRLHSAGLVRIEGRTVLLRCRLYADYFREHLRG